MFLVVTDADTKEQMYTSAHHQGWDEGKKKTKKKRMTIKKEEKFFAFPMLQSSPDFACCSVHFRLLSATIDC